MYRIILTFLFVVVTSVFPSSNIKNVIKEIKQGIFEQNIELLLKHTDSVIFEYSDLDVDGVFIKESDWKRDSFGVINFEYSFLKEDRRKSLDIFVSNCNIFKRKDWPIDFTGIQKVNENRYELKLNAICDISDISIIFILIDNKWKIIGWKFGAVRVESQ